MPQHAKLYSSMYQIRDSKECVCPRTGLTSMIRFKQTTDTDGLCYNNTNQASNLSCWVHHNIYTAPKIIEQEIAQCSAHTRVLAGRIRTCLECSDGAWTTSTHGLHNLHDSLRNVHQRRQVRAAVCSSVEGQYWIPDSPHKWTFGATIASTTLTNHQSVMCIRHCVSRSPVIVARTLDYFIVWDVYCCSHQW